MTSNPPAWHPATEIVKQISKDADALCKEAGASLATVALHYGLNIFSADHDQIPVVIGLSNLDEVHAAICNLSSDSVDKQKLTLLERKIKAMYGAVGYYGWSWSSP